MQDPGVIMATMARSLMNKELATNLVPAMGEETSLVAGSTCQQRVPSSLRTENIWVCLTGIVTYVRYLSLTPYVNIGIAFENLRGRLVPVVGVGEQEARVRINFGQARFLYQPG